MTEGRNAPMLAVQDLHAFYGKSHILRGVNFQVGREEVVSLLGRNGSGRSTTLKAIMGLVPPKSGNILLDGCDMAHSNTYKICRAGIAYVPEEREIFNNLTVDENLCMGQQPAPEGTPEWTIEQMFEYFPRLKERRKTQAGNLSGGEQQMLTICRSLLGNPKVLLIDEPTEGLAPKIVSTVAEVIRDIHRRGVSVVLVEQKLAIALKVSNHVCVMGHGKIVFEGTPDALTDNPQLLKEWLAV
jgi:branched-chain amino acid transport system ATP-binding protein